MNPFLRLLDALNRHDVPYVVVGGFAAAMHGVPRVTGDLDLIVDLAPAEAMKAIYSLLAMGLQPRLPVSPHDFADPAQRQEWIDLKGLLVFSMYDPTSTGVSVNLFAQHLVPSEPLYARSSIITLKGVPVRLCSVGDLIELKTRSARPIGLADAQALRALHPLSTGSGDRAP